MKKALLIMSAVFALVACNKENPVKESAIDPSKIVFNINVENADATKAIKTAWESGDVVYAFFEDNTTQYVKMTYDGSSWTYKDKNGGTTFSGLSLVSSGKKVSAVYMPGFVCSVDPTYNTDKWTFGSINGYFQKAESVDYTVTSTDDVTTLNATLSLTAPANISQIFIPSTEYSAPASGNEHVLTATHIITFTFSGIAPGGVADYGTGYNGFPLTAYSGTIGSDTGYYFWGILESADEYDFTFQLVERNADKKYDISSKSKSVHATVGSNFAAKLSGLTDNGKFVSLGYDGGPLWATGNIDKTQSKIVDPLEAGEYFRYGLTEPYSSSQTDYTGTEDPLDTSYDVANSVNTSWRIPTRAQFNALISNTTTAWKTGWTDIGTTKGGRLITSNVNGISLFFAAAGFYKSGYLYVAGESGLYWSSTPDNTSKAFLLVIDSGNIVTNVVDDRDEGYSVRPVQN